MGFFSRRRVPLPLRLAAAIPMFIGAGCIFEGWVGAALFFLLIGIIVAIITVRVTEPVEVDESATRSSIADQFSDSDWPPK